MATLGVAALGAAGVLAWRQRLPPAASVHALPVSAITSVAVTSPATGPAVVVAAPDAGTPVRPSFDIVRVAPDGSAVIAGRAEPNAEVALLDDGREIAHGRADPSGQFVVLPDKALPAGGQQLSLRAETAGQAAVAGDTPALVVVPDTQKSGDAAASPGAVAVLAPPDAAPRLLTVPSDSAGTPAGQVALGVVDYDAQGAIRFAGTARPDSLVRLYIDDRPAGEARADAHGRWGMVPGIAVSGGEHRLRADDLGPHGQVISRAELPFRRTLFAPDDLRDGRVVVQPRQTLWRIARHVYGHGVRYTLIYQANRDQIRDPGRIYPGQVFALPTEGAGNSSTGTPASSARR